MTELSLKKSECCSHSTDQQCSSNTAGKGEFGSCGCCGSVDWGSYGHFQHRGKCSLIADENWQTLLKHFGYYDKDGNHTKDYQVAYAKACEYLRGIK